MASYLHTCYRIGDIDRSVSFYEKLGFEEVRRMPIGDEAINVSPTVEPTVNSFAGQPGGAYTVQAAKRNADLFIQPPTAHVDFFDWKSAYKLIEIAFKHCREEIQAWKR